MAHEVYTNPTPLQMDISSSDSQSVVTAQGAQREVHTSQAHGQITPLGDGSGHYGPIVDSTRALANPIGYPNPVGAPTAYGEPRGSQMPVQVVQQRTIMTQLAPHNAPLPPTDTPE